MDECRRSASLGGGPVGPGRKQRRQRQHPRSPSAVFWFIYCSLYQLDVLISGHCDNQEQHREAAATATKRSGLRRGQTGWSRPRGAVSRRRGTNHGQQHRRGLTAAAAAAVMETRGGPTPLLLTDLLSVRLHGSTMSEEQKKEGMRLASWTSPQSLCL
ncbi:hypothetical protein PAMP_005354 [Pampus punctatissimus]